MDFDTDSTFVIVTRNLLFDPIIRKPEILQLYLYFILVANHKDNSIIQNGEIIIIKRGSTKTGIHLLAAKLDIPESTLYKRILQLVKLGYLKKESNTKFSTITVIDYDKITCQNDLLEHQRKNKGNSKEERGNTNNNDNNGDNEKNVKNGLADKSAFSPNIFLESKTIIIKFFLHYKVNYNWNNGKITGKDNRHLRLLLCKIVKRYDIANEVELPGILREYLKLIPPNRMRLIAIKLTVGSINKYFEVLISPKRSKYERSVRNGQAIRLDDLLTGILELQNKKLNK